MKTAHTAAEVRSVALSRPSAADQVRFALGMGISLVGAGVWVAQISGFLAAF